MNPQKGVFYEGKSGFYGFRAENGVGEKDFLLPDLRRERVQDVDVFDGAEDKDGGSPTPGRIKETGYLETLYILGKSL